MSTPARPTRLSARGAEFIGRFEGLRLEPYNDQAGHATIGYGHLIHYGHVTPADRARYKGFSKLQALRLLRQDAEKAAGTVRTHVKPVLSQPQFDALVSFAFNVGGQALIDSTLLRKLNRHARPSTIAAKREVCEQLLRWNKAGGHTLAGLTNRRKAEGELFSSGRYR